MKLIPLTQGKFTMVDDEDFEWLNQWKWYAKKDHKRNKFYVYRNPSRKFGERKCIQMHRIILRTPAGFYTDHIDGNPLNNQRSNLRICTHKENIRNAKKSIKNTSGFKGVSWHKRAGKWRARIGVNWKHIWLGNFDDIIDAVKAYNKAALKYHGEFANLNEQKVISVAPDLQFLLQEI